jgi:lysozyme
LRADEITFLFRNDVDAACAFMDRDIPWWRELPAAAQRVMINLCFNMGWGIFSKFTRFLADMRAHNYVNACYELQTSLWWREVGIRGPRIVARLRAIVSIPA